MSKIKVMIIDDSMSIRMLLREIIGRAPDMEVVGTARDPIEAKEKMAELKPDVLTLDIEMPKMDGLTFLEKLMKLNPMPVVMISTLTQEGSDSAIKALELGAVDVIGKPSAGGRALVEQQSESILNKVRAAAYAKVGTRAPKAEAPAARALGAVSSTKSLPTDTVLRRTNKEASGGPIIAIGASTGGTEAIRQIISTLPTTLPPIVIVQHISAGFSASFAKRLDALSKPTVCEVEAGKPLQSGHVYVAPGDRHFHVTWNGKNYISNVTEGERVNRHRPSVNVLFRSIADQAGKNAFAAILTGMGDDGAEGLKEIKDSGGKTVAQDQASCVVYGMPRAAVNLGAAEHEMDLETISGAMINAFLKKA